MPHLSNTGSTLADWLKAREKLHKFFTGETIILRDIFVFTDEDLARTDIMPSFRPIGTTNRTAVRWKKRLGVEVFEEKDVIQYNQSRYGNAPELYFINRSERPDPNTLGENAKTPDGLVALQKKMPQGQSWLGLYGWCDADSLYFAITGKHLDGGIWTWFPNDRLGSGGVTSGGWDPDAGRVGLCWYCSVYRSGCFGARLARRVPLKS